MRPRSTRSIALSIVALATACGKPAPASSVPQPNTTADVVKSTEPVPEELPEGVGAPVVFGDLGPRHTASVDAVAFSPDGSRFVAIGGENWPDPVEAIVWDTNSGERLAQTEASVSTVVAYLDDGVRLYDDALMAWLPGEPKRRLGCLDGYPIYSSEDGAWIYVTDESPTELMEAVSGRLVSVPGSGFIELWVVGDRMFAVNEHGNLRAGPLGEATQPMDLEGDRVLAVQPDGRRVALFTDAKRIRVREVDGVRLGASVEIRLEDLDEEYGDIEFGIVRWSPDGRFLAFDIRNYGFILVIDVPARRLAGRLVYELGNHPTSMAFSADSKRLAYGTEYGRIRVWDAETDALLHRTTGHLGPVWDVAISDDAQLIASFGDETARVHTFTDPARELAYGDHEHWVHAGAVTADGSQVVSCSDYGDVNVRATDSGKIVAKYDARNCEELELHGETAYVLGGTSVVGFSITTGAELARWDAAELSSDYEDLRMALSPAGDRLALAGDRGVAVHELPSGRVVWQRDWGRRADTLNHAIAYAPSGDELFVVAERLYRMDARTGEQLAALDYGGEGWITAAAYCGPRPIIGTSKGRLAILDDALAPTLQWRYPDGSVYSLVARPDLVVAGGSDGRVRAWSVAQ